MEVEILPPACCPCTDGDVMNGSRPYTDQTVNNLMAEGNTLSSDEQINQQTEGDNSPSNGSFVESSDILTETLNNLEKLNEDLKNSPTNPFSVDLTSLPYPPGYSIIKRNGSQIDHANPYKALKEIEEESSKEPRMTKKFLKQHCAKHKLYQTPQLNDILYLHYNGFSKIENLEEYTGLRCLFLEVNGILKIDGLQNQTELRSLYLSKNLIRQIENLDHMRFLDTLDVSHNMISKIENLDMLPNFTKLIISHNKLSEIEDLVHLTKCEHLSVLDIQQNYIKNPNVVEEVFAKMPSLKVLYNQGNAFIREVKNYRKNIINQCKNLTYLDDRPVFPKDRACAEAFYAEGIEKEREVRQQWIEAEQRKILESVKWLSETRKRIEARRREAELRRQAEEAGLPSDNIHVSPGDIDWLYGDVTNIPDEDNNSDNNISNDGIFDNSAPPPSCAGDGEACPRLRPRNGPMMAAQVYEEICTEMENMTAEMEMKLPSCTQSDNQRVVDNEGADTHVKNINDQTGSHSMSNEAISKSFSDKQETVQSFSNNEEISVLRIGKNSDSVFSQPNKNDTHRNDLPSVLNIIGNSNNEEDEEDKASESDFTDDIERDAVLFSSNGFKAPKNLIMEVLSDGQLEEDIILSEETIREDSSRIPKSAFIEDSYNEECNLFNKSNIQVSDVSSKENNNKNENIIMIDNNNEDSDEADTERIEDEKT
uniref:Dynein assembly factor 1, axonemal homolog n=1 Tax=Trichobilharzia regenti TaxID=157069 RepID=A0AA85J3R9_TRIRE|nr:unnamed protein product [Trichobilharzia regenti]